MRSGTLYWNHLKTYNDSTRVRIMAGAIVHEAYHGKCYGVFGLNAYLAKKRMERICRNREVRFLNQISNIPDSEIHDDLCVRINMLNAPAI
ncbi:MAG TPA: hypothetical protein VJ904_11685, partial [Tichowtungia sp.]|nr:hypothetical protein [Tichowtungia sp.]